VVIVQENYCHFLCSESVELTVFLMICIENIQEHLQPWLQVDSVICYIANLLDDISNMRDSQSTKSLFKYFK